MSIKNEMLKMQLEIDIKKYLSGAIIEPNMKVYRIGLIERAKELGINYELLEAETKRNMPEKRTYSDLMESMNVDNLEVGLHSAFEQFLIATENKQFDKINSLFTRELTSETDILPQKSPFFDEQKRNSKRMDVLRALCISLKTSTDGYQMCTEQKLKEFLNSRGINPNIDFTKEQLNYIHNLPLDNLETFMDVIDTNLIPSNLYGSTDVWQALDPKGTKFDYLYNVQETGKYRVYINTPQYSEQTDTFLTDYMKMCISKKLPFNMKGSQEIGKGRKDNTVLYLDETHLLDYLQILDQLGQIHPEIISNFGTPPLLTNSIVSKNCTQEWIGFSDMGEDYFLGTYNDRTRNSCMNAFLISTYTMMDYGMKNKLSENGFSLKTLSYLKAFKMQNYIEGKTTTYHRYSAFTPSGFSEKSELKTPLKSDGTLERGTQKYISQFTTLMSDEIMQIVKNPQKKQEMFENFKKYYVLMENYYKYNSKYNYRSKENTFEDFRDLPTTLSIGIKEKAYEEKIKLHQIFSEEEIGKATINISTTMKDQSQGRIRRDELEIETLRKGQESSK